MPKQGDRIAEAEYSHHPMPPKLPCVWLVKQCYLVSWELFLALCDIIFDNCKYYIRTCISNSKHRSADCEAAAR